MKWIKYVCIIMKAIVTDRYVVDWHGSTYVVSGNIVKKIK